MTKITRRMLYILTLVALSPSMTLAQCPPDPDDEEVKETKVEVKLLKKTKFPTYTRVEIRATVSMKKGHTFESYKGYFTDPKGKELAPTYTKTATPEGGKTVVFEFYVDAVTVGGNWNAIFRLNYKDGATPKVTSDNAVFSIP